MSGLGFPSWGPQAPPGAGEDRSGETEWPRVTGSGTVAVEKTELQEEMRSGWGHEKHPQSRSFASWTGRKELRASLASDG